jgi:hypothetical protein
MSQSRELSAAVDRVLKALGMSRANFSAQSDSAILDRLSLGFTGQARFALAFAANAARRNEGLVNKICYRCQREFWIDQYLAPMPAFDRCGRVDCSAMAANAACPEPTATAAAV